MTSLKYPDFKGPAKPVEDTDLPRIAAEIGVGEDEVHMLLDVEAAGKGYDALGRPKLLREGHYLYALLKGAERDRAVKEGLAYPHYGDKPYPKESYSWLEKAMKINPTAALMSCSWGGTQIMGKNFALAGFADVYEMVNALCEDEENHVEAMIQFVKNSHLDDDLRRLAALTRPTTAADTAPIARVYNGASYATNQYDVKLAASHNKWRKIPDTPYHSGGIVGGGLLPRRVVEVSTVGPVIVPPTAIEQSTISVATIKDLQSALKSRGYVEVGAIDGKIGKNTLSAIAAFQIAQGLPVDGKVSSDLYQKVLAAPMRPVSEDRANAKVATLLDQKIPGSKEGVILRNIGSGLLATTGLGAVFDGGPVDLDHVMNSATQFHALYVMFQNLLPWLIGIAVGGTVLYFGQKLIRKQLDGFRKGTVR